MFYYTLPYYSILYYTVQNWGGIYFLDPPGGLGKSIVHRMAAPTGTPELLWGSPVSLFLRNPQFMEAAIALRV